MLMCRLDNKDLITVGALRSTSAHIVVHSVLLFQSVIDQITQTNYYRVNMEQTPNKVHY